MAYEPLQFELVRDNVLRIAHQSVPVTPSTYLTSPNSAGGTTLTVRDNSGFSNSNGGDLLLIGNFGDEQTEIKQVNGAVSAGTSITTTALTFSHPINTPVRKVLFDQIEVYGNSSASSSGAVLIATISIDATSNYTEYVVSGTTYDYYGIRGIRSVSTTYQGAYSDFISASGFDTNTVGFIIRKAFEASGEEERATGPLSKQWAYDQIFLGEQDVAKELKKWSWLQEFEYDAGNVTLGMRGFTLPTNCSDRNTAKAIMGMRIGTGPNMKYITKAEYESLFRDVAYTTVGTTYVAGATSIILTDSRDFEDSGSFNVYTGSSIDNVSYTTNTRSTNTVSGVTSNDSGGTAGEPVWQNEPQGAPLRYTIYEGQVYFDTVPDNSVPNLIGSNIWLDYYKNVTRVTSDGDQITVPDPYCIQQWLEAMIKKTKAGGKLAEDDQSWLEYQRRKKRLVNNEVEGQGSYIVPSFYEDETIW